MTGKKGETPSNEQLMPDRATIVAERRVQTRLSFSEAFQLIALIAAFVAIWQLLGRQPNRTEPGWKASEVVFADAGIGADDVYPFNLAGAWSVSSQDPRFGGFSGLAVNGDRLIALTDQGSVASFPQPSGDSATAIVGDLPDGPFSGRFSWNRDSEALVTDPLGRGWWVAFEKHHELWLFDRGFTRGLKRVRLGARRWPNNLGIEGLVALPGPELLLFPEALNRMFRMRGGHGTAVDLDGRRLSISEATLLPSGAMVAMERGFGPGGFQNRLVTLEPTPRGFRIVQRFVLKLGRLDNMEGMAAQSLADGTTRLWMISDDNFQRPLRTLLLALDLPRERRRD